jgi:hypothetical protein
VRTNQLGDLPTARNARWVSHARQPPEFGIRGGDGTAVFGGRTCRWPVPEPTSGMALHVLSFSAARAEAEDVAIEMGVDVIADGRNTPPTQRPTAIVTKDLR